MRVSTTVAPSPTDTVAPGSTGPSGRRIATYVVGGVGLAGLVGGGVMGALALGQKGILDKHCGTAVGQTDKASCDPTGLDASSNAQSMALGSTIGFAVGGAAAATAVSVNTHQTTATSSR